MSDILILKLDEELFLKRERFYKTIVESSHMMIASRQKVSELDNNSTPNYEKDTRLE
jgi:hypothetical protein